MKTLLLVALLLSGLTTARAQSQGSDDGAMAGTGQQEIELNSEILNDENTPPAPTAYFGHIRGIVFHDVNLNCLRDPNEPLLRDQILQANPGHYVITTDSLGMFDLRLPYGTYQLSYGTNCQWSHSCSLTGLSLNVRLNDSVRAVNGYTFGLTENSHRDMAVFGASSHARPGFDLTYMANIANQGTMGLPVLVRFVPDGISEILSPTDIDPRPDSSQGDTLFWRFQTPAHGNRTLQVTTRVPANVHLLGAELVARFEVLQARPDTYTANNIAVIRNIVRDSFDPNDKSVDPPGNITHNDTMLTYLIRFQNTGTDTALTITVRDTISPNLDLSSIRTLLASHRFSFKIESGRAAEWRFSNIHLVDSNRNEDRSHGFVKFSIKRDKGLTAGNSIYNKAYIYFDFNPPIPTNTVQNMLVANKPLLSYRGAIGKAEVLPNPLNGKGVLRLNGAKAKGLGVLNITDAFGRLVFAKDKLAGTEFEVSAPEKPGVYYVRVCEGGQILGRSRFVVE